MSDWFSKKVPADFNLFIHVTRDYFFLFAFLMAAACKALLAWDVERFVLHVSFIDLFFSFLLCIAHPPPAPLYFSIYVKFNPGYTRQT